MNGELRTASESLARAKEEITKEWDKGETRLSNQAISDKRTALKEIVSYAEDIISIVAKFDLIANK